MKIIGLDGVTYTWNYATKKKCNKKSKLHMRVREYLKSMFPLEQIYEEVFLPGTVTVKHKGLRCDFYIPNQRLIVEAQGEQHFHFNSFHYDNQLKFGKSLNRDRDKEIWCEINGITYVGLRYDESESEWTNRISSC